LPHLEEEEEKKKEKQQRIKREQMIQVVSFQYIPGVVDAPGASMGAGKHVGCLVARAAVQRGLGFRAHAANVQINRLVDNRRDFEGIRVRSVVH
jgi:hypothetical protein